MEIGRGDVRFPVIMNISEDVIRRRLGGEVQSRGQDMFLSTVA
jgi:hypothetical protein